MPTVSLGSCRLYRILGQLYDVPVDGDRPAGIRGAEAPGEYLGSAAGRSKSREGRQRLPPNQANQYPPVKPAEQEQAQSTGRSVFLDMLQTVFDESSAVELLF